MKEREMREMKVSENPVSLQVFVSWHCVHVYACLRMHAN